MKKKGKSRKRPKGKPAGSKYGASGRPVTEIPIGHVTRDKNNSVVGVHGIVEKIIQTGGPTIFMVSDGTGTLALKGFVSAGERAYPDINVNDPVRAVVTIGEYEGSLEGEINSIRKLGDKEKQDFISARKRLSLERAIPKEVPFLVKSPVLDKLKDTFVKAATEIRLAVIENRPIIVRHHNDTDGYSAGYALERAIIDMINDIHKTDKAEWEYFVRAPCSAPYYEIDDAIRDAAFSLRNVAKYSAKMPLVIIADNGSSPQDLLAIKHGKVHGMEFIVIDHHFSDEDVITPEVLAHINPFLVGEDGAAFSAGMLCTELARFIYPVENISQIPAMAAYADRVDMNNPEVVDEYLKIADKEGYSKELLLDISTTVDFVSSRLRFMEAREYIEVLFGEPRKKQKQLVGILAPYIKDLEAKGLSMAISNASVEKIGKTTFQVLNIDETFPGFGFYPKPGMCVGLLHDHIQKEEGLDDVVTVGVMPTAMTFRATDEAHFSVHELMMMVHDKLPDAFVEGGGHKNAGTLSFVPKKQQEVFSLVKDYIRGKQ